MLRRALTVQVLAPSPMVIDALFSSPSATPSSPSSASSSSSSSPDSSSSSGSPSSSDDDAMNDVVELLLLTAPVRLRDCEAATGFWEDVVITSYTDVQFKEDFRLTRRSFFELNRLLVAECDGHGRSGRPPVHCDKALAMCFWRLANTGTVRTVARQFNMSMGWTDAVIQRMLRLMERVFVDEVRLPHDGQGWGQLREQWKGRSGFHNVVAALDGSHLPLEYRPGTHTRTYANRKKFFSIQLQAVVSVGGFILHAFVGNPGSYHDARVLRLSHGLLLQLTRTLPPHHLILADAAYPCLPWLMTPYRSQLRIARSS